MICALLRGWRSYLGVSIYLFSVCMNAGCLLHFGLCLSVCALSLLLFPSLSSLLATVLLAWGCSCVWHLDIPANHSNHPPDTNLTHLRNPVPAGSLSHLCRYSSLPVPVFEKTAFANLLALACFVCCLAHSLCSLPQETIIHSSATKPDSHLLVHGNTPDHFSVQPACLLNSGPHSLPVPLSCQPKDLHVPKLCSLLRYLKLGASF